MAIDPKMLTAYMSEQEPADEELVADYEIEDEMPEEGEENAEEGGEDAAAFEAFLTLLMESAPAIESAAQAVEVLDIADELPDELAEAILASLEDMPPELVDGMVQYLATMEPDDLHQIVETLEEAGQLENDGIVVPYLYWASRLMAEQSMGEEGEEEPAEDEEAEEAPEAEEEIAEDEEAEEVEELPA